MKKISNKLILATAVLALSGCSFVSEKNEDLQKNPNKEIYIGATSGAVVGSLGGAPGILVGGLVGGAAGGVYKYMENNKEEEIKQGLDDLGITLEKSDGNLFIKFNNDILFKKSSSELSPEGEAELDKFSEVLNKVKGNKALKVSGHTDNSGSRTFNLALSEERAKNVAFYLYKKGFEANKIDYTGYADIKPLNDNLTEEERKANRRVTIEIITQNANKY